MPLRGPWFTLRRMMIVLAVVSVLSGLFFRLTYKNRQELPLTPEQTAAIEIAKSIIVRNETWAERATYDASRWGDGWTVIVWRIERFDWLGRPRFTPGGHRLVLIDAGGNAYAYLPGE
jgi:hypothetical protein